MDQVLNIWWHRKTWFILFGVTAFVGLWLTLNTFTSIFHVQSQGANTQTDWGFVIIGAQLWAFTLAFFVVGVWLLEKHIAWNRHKLWLWVAVHLVESVLVALLHTFFIVAFEGTYFVMQGAALTEWFNTPSFWPHVVHYATIPWLFFWLSLAAYYGVHAYHQWQEQKLQTSKLETELLQARFQTLQAQLQPHFLFNALQTISSLMRRDVKRAQEMLAHLGDLLRFMLKDQQPHWIALEQEIDWLKKYLYIQSLRFADLDIAWEVEDAAKRCEIPAFILQPLVENALKHGLEPLTVSRQLTIGAKLDNNSLSIWIEDNGPGLSQPSLVYGDGLSNVENRLKTFYGTSATLCLENKKSGLGLRAQVQIPIQERSTA